MNDETIFQTEHLNNEILTHYFKQHFVTFSYERLELNDYKEIQGKLEQLIREKTNGK